MPILYIEALDTLIFGDGKPFNKDGDNWVGSLFPPATSVLYGALRGKYFAENIQELPMANEDDDPTRDLKIKGVFLGMNQTLFFPMPLDLLFTKEKDSKIISLKLCKNEVISNCDTEMILLSSVNQRAENMQDGFLDYLSLQDYLNGEVENVHGQVLTEFITPESKIGIQINKETNLAKEKHLYRIGMIRPETYRVPKDSPRKRIYHKMNLVVDYENLSLPSEGLLKIGAENKMAFYVHGSRLEKPDVSLKGSRFKLYLATPAKFKQGWLPEWIDKETLLGTYKGISVKLLTAAIGKYLSIGGFDMKKKAPKTMVRAVPAGSVYYFEIQDNSNVKNVMDKFHYQNISDEDAEQGFGLAFVGGVE